MTTLDRLLEALPKWTFVGGKGGVGKTTCATALAARAAARETATLLLSTDPARSLADAIGAPLSGSPRRVGTDRPLDAFQLDPAAARDDFLARWRSVLVSIVDRGTYLDREDIYALIDAALPGADEAMALITLLDLETRGDWHRVVVDTAPTGHTLRLLQLPGTFRALVSLLDAMQEKHRFMVSALTHRYRTDVADAFLEEMDDRLTALRDTLADPDRAAFVLVTRPEPMVAVETGRYAETLADLGMRVGAVIVNATPATWSEETRAALDTLDGVAADAPRYHVPELARSPMGLAAIEAWGAELRAGRPRPQRGVGKGPRATTRPAPRRSGGGPKLAARPLTIVGGKGGVGKTTAACALAIAAAAPEAPALVVSTDPAPSVADALDQEVGEQEVSVRGAAGLFARQIDAAAAFDRLRGRYSAQVDEVFASLISSGMDAVHDRVIMRDLLAFAPPGIDEVYALSALGETLADSRYVTIVVDPAPTGHLLRLLEMPALALEWSHRLMRMMLKYRQVASLGDAAEELLAFSRRTRVLGELLRDRARAGVVLVSLDEPLVRAETARLVGALRALDLEVCGLLWNRVAGPPAPLSVAPPVAQFEAEAVDPPPRGVARLREWQERWMALPASEHG